MSKACANRGFSTKLWDIKYGDSHDLGQRKVYDKFRSDLSSKRVLGVCLAPPCSSFSVAHDRGTPIISKLHPWGLPNLENYWQERINIGNVAAKQSLKLCRLCIKYSVPFVLEHPVSSRIWATPEVKKLLDSGCFDCVADQCQYGARWRKRTRFLCYNIEDSERLTLRCYGKGVCSKTGKPHFGLEGGHRTKLADRYPPKLCHNIAHVLCEAVAHKAVLHDIRCGSL